MGIDTHVRERTLARLAEIAEVAPGAIEGHQRLREDLGMDSIGSLELLSCIGEDLGIDLDVEEAMGITTVDDACAFVHTCYLRRYPEIDARHA